MTRKLKQNSILILTLVCIISFAGLFGGCATAAGNQIPTSTGKNSSDQIDPSNGPAADPAEKPLDGKLKVSYIDVGQGDSIFIEFPNGKSMLIDAGNPPDGSTVVSYIRHEGVSKIDYLVATHPHSDHIGGLPQVISTFDIGKVYMPKVSTTTKVFENLLSAIEDKGLKINTAKAGVNILHEGNLRVDILAPVSDSYTDLNNYSVVIKVVYGASSFLFMGDAEKLSENQITADVNADVLKVGHHGSQYSSSQSFIAAVSPEDSVISVGAGNQYGHPNRVTLNTLLAAGSKVYRTDLDGTVVFVSDGTKITVSKAPSTTSVVASPTKQVTTPTNQETTSTKSIAGNVIVYVTDSGTKYHNDGCRYLKSSKHAITLQQAKDRGYTPCSVCHPPQ